MKACIIAVGTELLGTERLDTNSLFLTSALHRFGCDLIAKSVVGDSAEVLAEEIRYRLEACDLIVLTGGLGPTTDDLTRPAVAAALGRDIAIDEALVEALRQRFASFGRQMPESNRRQAERIEGADMLENPRGSAPGMRLEQAGTTLFLFPGVPREMRAMTDLHLLPWLRQQTVSMDGVAISHGVVKVACLAESEVEQRIQPVYERFGREAIAVLASPGEVRLHATARGTETQREDSIGEMLRALRDAVGPAAYTDRDVNLEQVVGELLADAGRTLVTAESCTGGLVAERLTRIAGSSVFFLGGVVSYSNELKAELLGVDPELIALHGAVSEEVARAMAIGARRRLGGDYAVSITGIAGPGGGTDHKPVGTVHLALAGPVDGRVEHRRVRFPGDREQVRQQTSQFALDMVRRDLLAIPNTIPGASASKVDAAT